MRRSVPCVFALAAFVVAPITALAQGACEAQRLAPPADPPPNDFGDKVEVDGRFWFVGDDGARTLCHGDPFNCSAGAVHVYELVDGRLEFFQTLSPPNPQLGDRFGANIDTHDGRLIVGVPNYGWSGTERPGGAFVYGFDDGFWSETGRLIPPESVDPLLRRDMGTRASIHGDMAILKSSDDDLFRYQRTASGWEYREHFTSPDGLPREAGFGFAIELAQDWVFISAAWDSSIVLRGGSVYAYRRGPDNTLEFVQRLTGDDAPGGAANNVFFGWSMSFDAGRLAIGSPGATRDALAQGSVQLYDLVDGRWRFAEEALHESPEEIDELGQSISLHGDLLVVGASGDGAPGTPGSGYAFRRGVDGRWHEAAWLVPEPPFRTRQFGWELASDGRHALFGAPKEELPSGERPGAAYFFDLACNPCPADLDADGALTIFDFLTFLNLFDAGDPQADFDGDGELT
ncbi:MAG: GC-type dockerin domain-anchored protein, partial [Phycisphaerales bacterium JB060]